MVQEFELVTYIQLGNISKSVPNFESFRSIAIFLPFIVLFQVDGPGQEAGGAILEMLVFVGPTRVNGKNRLIC